MNHRRRTDATQATVSLFPFLAVLLCTMGALLVLLVVMARQARVGAARERLEQETEKSLAADLLAQPQPVEPVAADLSAQIADRAAELAGLRDRMAGLAKMRRDGETRLTDSQRRLGHAEAHQRQLQNQLASAYATAEQIATLGETRFTDRQRANAELIRLRTMIREAEIDVATARDEAANRPKSYAIVPYQGPHGTHRRPIYIECRQNAILLQPEGIELSAVDFQEPIGAANPLAAALRAANDYHTSRLDDPNQPLAQPYPLLLVRPGGILAYYHAREAIASWGPDFGYELVDGDWTLDLPAADPELAYLLYRAVETARARKLALAQAAPRRFQRSGGVDTSGDHTGAAGGGFAIDLDQLPSEGGEGSGAGGQGSRDKGRRSEVGGQASGDGGQGTGDSGQRSEDGGRRSGDRGRGTREESDHGVSAGRGSNSRAGADANDPAENRYAPTANPRRLSSSRQTPHGEPPGTNSSGNSMAGGSAKRGTPGGDSSFGSAGPSGGSRTSIGNRPDWPKPEPTPGAVPIRRAIHVVVRNDRLAILPEQGVGGGRVIPVDGDVDASLTELAVAMRDHMRGWGIAGRGLYWKPILILKAAPDGAANAAHLVRRLRGSGIEIKTPGAIRR